MSNNETKTDTMNGVIEARINIGYPLDRLEKLRELHAKALADSGFGGNRSTITDTVKWSMNQCLIANGTNPETLKPLPAMTKAEVPPEQS